MLTRRRVLWTLPIVVIVLAVAYTAWLLWQVQGDLREAQSDVTRFQVALEDRDAAARTEAAADLKASAASADGRTDGVWWSAMTHVPVLGDDATGIRALSHSLSTIASDGVEPMADGVDGLDGVVDKGRIDLDVVAQLADPVARAQRAFASASKDVSGLDSSGYAGPLRSRFEKYVELVQAATSGLSSAEQATEVLPTMLGGDGPKNYLLVFQNNAEIRATGGLPGSWALVQADAGKLTLARQGSAGDFVLPDQPVLPLSEGELDVYDRQLGTYFQDAGFTPDFPRAADLWSAHWDQTFPDVSLDGVVSLDPVALSYLLAGTGPVRVDDTTLTAGNLVEELLSKPYQALGPVQQDQLFQDAAKSIFEASTTQLASPLKFAQGLNRAAREGRFLVASFDQPVADSLQGTRVQGALAADDGATPHVDIGLNDATGSKMSYYLRYWADVKATGCESGIQSLAGSMTLGQSISPAEAAKLPVSVTGGGNYGTDPGSQLVLVRLYGPYGGSIADIRLDGKALRQVKTVDLNGRPVATVVTLLSNRDDLVLNWTMKTGSQQTGDIELGLTPSIVPGGSQSRFTSAC